MLVITESITGGGELGGNDCRDITGVHLVNIGSVVCMHLHDTAETFVLTLGGVEYVRTGGDMTGVYAEEAELTNVRVGHDLERES